MLTINQNTSKFNLYSAVDISKDRKFKLNTVCSGKFDSDNEKPKKGTIMPNYKVTVSKSFYCAFRCIDCHEMNVTKGVFKTDNSGGDFDRRRAQSTQKSRRSAA